MRVAVIGASGFIGSSLCSALELSGHTVLAFVRPSRIRDFQKNKGLVLIDDIWPQERWHELINDIDIVIYGRELFLEIRNHIKCSLATGELSPLDQAMWKDAYERRNCSLSFKDFYFHEIRKYNKY